MMVRYKAITKKHPDTSSSRDAPSNEYKLDKQVIASDLSKERPQWILSAYGPGRDTPAQLFGGHPREQSFEELRIRHYELAAQGKQQEAIQEAQTLVRIAEQQIQTVLNDVDGAIKYIVDTEKQHPNRVDICSQSSHRKPSNQPSTSTFGQPSNPAPALGQPSAPTTFGKPSAPTFGQPSAPPSGLAQIPTPAFGQPSLGRPGALGRPTTSFGQPSNLRNSSAPTPAFGQPATPTPFGGGLGNQAPNPFSQPSTTTQTGTSGQSSAPAQTGVFGGASSAASSAPFAKPVTPAIVSGQGTAAPANPFSQQSRAEPSPFGQPTGSQAPNAFAQQATPAPTGAVIGSPVVPGTKAQVLKDAQGRLRMWNGKTVNYVNDEPRYKRSDGNWETIWFPDGPPAFTKTKDLPDEVYDQATKESYMFLKEHGSFKNGVIPLVPPKREWCNWNL